MSMAEAIAVESGIGQAIPVVAMSASSQARKRVSADAFKNLTARLKNSGNSNVAPIVPSIVVPTVAVALVVPKVEVVRPSSKQHLLSLPKDLFPNCQPLSEHWMCSKQNLKQSWKLSPNKLLPLLLQSMFRLRRKSLSSQSSFKLQHDPLWSRLPFSPHQRHSRNL